MLTGRIVRNESVGSFTEGFGNVLARRVSDAIQCVEMRDMYVRSRSFIDLCTLCQHVYLDLGSRQNWQACFKTREVSLCLAVHFRSICHAERIVLVHESEDFLFILPDLRYSTHLL